MYPFHHLQIFLKFGQNLAIDNFNDSLIPLQISHSLRFFPLFPKISAFGCPLVFFFVKK